MNARDIIKLAAQLYVFEEFKKNITVLTNIQKGKDINIDVFVPKLTQLTVSDFAKYLQKAIEMQPEEERAKHRKFFGEPISFCRCVARGHKMASVIYDIYVEMLCEDCLTEVLDKKITAIKPKEIE